MKNERMSKKNSTRSRQRIQAIPLDDPAPHVLHSDACVFCIHTDTDSEVLREGFPYLIDAIRHALGGYKEAPDWKTRFETWPGGYPRKPHWKWKYRLRSPYTQVSIYGTAAHLGAVPKIARKRRPPNDLRSRLFPSESEILDLDYRWNQVGEIWITNRRKQRYYAEHEDSLRAVISAIEDFGVKLIARRIEIALDTVDRIKGLRYQKALLPPYFRPNWLFHCHGRGPMNRHEGPSTNGLNEYMNYRPKARRDLRPSSERPRGGRRQWHIYGRLPYRIEARLFTDAIREIMRKNRMTTCTGLLEFIPRMIPKLFRFREFDLASLYREYPSTRRMGLEALSVRGQYYMLLKSGFDRRQINRFLRKLPFPKQNVVMLARWPEFLTYTGEAFVPASSYALGTELWITSPGP